MSDKKISELPLASAINPTDVSILVSGGTDYQFAFTSLLQLIASNLTVGANLSFGTTLPQNTSGKNGDVFINTSVGSFAQKISGTWAVVYTMPSSGSVIDGTVLYGLGVPGSSTGNNGDTYINTGTGIFYKKATGSWSQAFSMQTGPQGPQGTAGTNGTNGTNGYSILHGSTNPSNLSTGVNDDFYINTTNFTFFGPKTAGNWGSATSLVGIGLQSGGTTGQVLSKVSNDDFDTAWVNPLIIDDTSVSTTKVYSSHKTTDLITSEASTRSAADTTLQTNIDSKQYALGFTPENVANKNITNGYAGLDSSAKVPSSLLPSYVDDVLEYANFAALPGIGETSKIYVALDTNAEYRWSGSTYIQLVASPGSTDAVPEGSINLYFTAARVLATVLSGISFVTGSAIISTDTMLIALGKLQAQISQHTLDIANLNTSIGNVQTSLTAEVALRISGESTLQSNINSLTTDNVSEGSTNKYFTTTRVLATVLSGISFLTSTAVVATDSVLVGIGKLQAQFNSLSAIFQSKEDQHLSTTDGVTFAGLNLEGMLAQEFNLDGADLSSYYGHNAYGQLLVGQNQSAGGGESDFISMAGTGPVAYGGFSFSVYTTAGVKKSVLTLNGFDNAAVFTGRVSPGIIDASATPATVYLTYDPATKALISRTVAEVASDIGTGGGGGSSSKISYNFYQSVL